MDLQIRQAMERGEFADLPGHGKPIEGLGAEHDPDWWIKQLAEREKIAVVPFSVQLRKDDAELDDLLDRLNVEAEVRREVEEFNQRVIAARYRLPEGPPLITMPRDVDETVAAWVARREARRARQAELLRAGSRHPRAAAGCAVVRPDGCGAAGGGDGGGGGGQTAAPPSSPSHLSKKLMLVALKLLDTSVSFTAQAVKLSPPPRHRSYPPPRTLLVSAHA